MCQSIFNFIMSIDNGNSNKRCFIISPIGEEGSDIRVRSDKILRHLISEPIKQYGYEIIRADKISEPGIITTQIIEHIVNSELVVADLTDKNPNVFYELAIRHAIRKHLVQIIKLGEIIPFDVAATRIIQFDLSDLDSVANAKDQISSQVRAIESHSEGDDIQNPISVSLDLKILRESNNIEERSLADIVEAISDLRTTVISTEKSAPLLKIQNELKLMLDSLVVNLENTPNYKNKRKKRFANLVEQAFYFSKKVSNPNIFLLFLASIFREDSPIIYEIILDAYRDLKLVKNEKERMDIFKGLERSLDFIEMTNIEDSESFHQIRFFIMDFMKGNFD